VPTATYIALANLTLSSGDSSITFSSIPATYRDLVLVVSGSSTGGGFFAMKLNSSATGYSRIAMAGNGSTTTSYTGGSSEYIDTGFAIGANNSFVHISNFIDYSATDKSKSVLVRGNTPANTANQPIAAGYFRWDSNNAINSIEVFMGNNFDSGTTFSLYGIVS
jgi:hypothetical protein